MVPSSLAAPETRASRRSRPGIRKPLNIGHRGSSGAAPEHTIAAYDLALDQGVDYLELDLQMTRDGALVALHDPLLDRTARGPLGYSTGAVGRKTLEQVKRCDAGSWFNESHPERAERRFAGAHVPTLEEVFRRYGTRVSYYIEPKHPVLYPGMEEELLRVVDAYGLARPAYERRAVLIQSFDAASLKKIHALDPQLPLVQLYHRAGDVTVVESLPAVAKYAVAVGPLYLDASERLVRAAHDLGLEVHPYTVNSSRNMQRLLDRGVDGIFTDFPCRLQRVLDAAIVDTAPAATPRASSSSATLRAS